jgi:hypothetical protein
VLRRVVKPNAKMVVRMMSSMGESETIVRHPDLIDAIVAAGRDPIASATDLAEFRAILPPARGEPDPRHATRGGFAGSRRLVR